MYSRCKPLMSLLAPPSFPSLEILKSGIFLSRVGRAWEQGFVRPTGCGAEVKVGLCDAAFYGFPEKLCPKPLETRRRLRTGRYAT